MTAVIDSVCTLFPSKYTGASVEENIPLQERTEQLQYVVSTVVKNLKKILNSKTNTQITASAKTDLVIPTFVGGAGVGKVEININLN